MSASTPFSGSLDVYEWISAFVNLERGQSVRNIRLDRMKALAELAGHPEKCAPSFHVAGSKGKGSVTGMIAAILEAAGTKTALYASPHVSDFRERVLSGKGFFDEALYSLAGNALRETVEKLPASPHAALFDSRLEAGEAPTFFELMTLWFFLCARFSSAGAMAVETGMGGRLDTTNILDPLVSVITLIELEHTEYLGSTLGAVAREKAGIIKKGRPLVLAEQSPEALEVFREQAALKGSPLLYFPEIAGLRDVRVKAEGTSFTLTLAKRGKAGTESFSDLFVPIPGEVQAANAGLAILALRTAYPDIAEEAIRRGLGSFTLPARFERILEEPPFIVDGAHTGRSVALCLKTFRALYGEGGILVFGCAAGKDTASMARLSVPCFSTIIITTPGTFKKSSPEDIYRVFTLEAEKLKSEAAAKRGAPPSLPEILFIPDTPEAVKRAIGMAKEKGLPVLGTGSFYLAAEIKKG